MARRKGNKMRPPLTGEALNELALAYVGRFATTRSKLASYLSRKLRERGWAGTGAADVEAIAERLANLGYVDDAAYALSKSRALTGRGYGVGRVRQALRAAGVEDEDSDAARELAEAQAVEAALRFARRRRLGPFGDGVADRAGRERALAAMIRAGHPFALSRSILSLEPGSAVEVESLSEKS
jgi:regulatory protein